jgi:hypothetical protein
MRSVRKSSAGRARTVSPLSPEKVETVRDSMLRQGLIRDATLVSVLAYAGLRPGEALALLCRHIRERTILVEAAVSLGAVAETKTRRRRTVRLLGPLHQDLAEWRLRTGRPTNEELVFPGHDGRLWSGSAYKNWHRRVYRPTAVEVARQAGHSPKTALDTYAHVFEEFDPAERVDAASGSAPPATSCASELASQRSSRSRETRFSRPPTGRAHHPVRPPVPLQRAAAGVQVHLEQPQRRLLQAHVLVGLEAGDGHGSSPPWESMLELLAAVCGDAGERAVFRVDHLLGMATVHNLLGLRLANPMIEAVWNGGHIDRVEILWEEDLALEGRAGYYDGTGALKDVMQNHMLQTLALIAMEPPARAADEDLRDSRARALAAVRPPPRESIASLTRRARYRAGRIGDQAVPPTPTRTASTPNGRPKPLPSSSWPSRPNGGLARASSCAPARRWLGAARERSSASEPLQRPHPSRCARNRERRAADRAGRPRGLCSPADRRSGPARRLARCP